MESNLYLYLHYEWGCNNHPKYFKYFNDWVNNLTDDQIHYYLKLWYNEDYFTKKLF